MRGSTDPQLAMLTALSTEDLIPDDHPIHRIRVVADAVLAELDPVFEEMYATSGRRSVPPEVLLKATVPSVPSANDSTDDLLFKWFLDMRIDQPAFDATTFTKNRHRLLAHDVADEFFAEVVRQAKLRRYISSDHFSVDGTPLNAWASPKSFKPKDGTRRSPRRAATSRSGGAARSDRRRACVDDGLAVDTELLGDLSHRSPGLDEFDAVHPSPNRLPSTHRDESSDLRQQPYEGSGLWCASARS